MTPIAVIGLVMLAMRKSVSAVIFWSVVTSRTPQAYSNLMPSLVPTAITAPAVSPSVTNWSNRAASGANGLASCASSGAVRTSKAKKARGMGGVPGR